MNLFIKLVFNQTHIKYIIYLLYTFYIPIVIKYFISFFLFAQKIKNLPFYSISLFNILQSLSYTLRERESFLYWKIVKLNYSIGPLRVVSRFSFELKKKEELYHWCKSEKGKDLKKRRWEMRESVNW